ncbi:MAG: hypothetical protein NTZ59_03225 [Bacteroidetes bacterium]|nr:hypothetical protein [Bacteroidota bacterium]
MKLQTQKVFTAIVFCSLIFTSCLKDVGHKTYKVYTPVIEQTSTLRSKVKSVSPISVSNAGKLFVIGNYIFLNEKNMGVHIIDNTNPSNPINISFINIPGNFDVAVIGNTLYADCYTDLLTIDISNPNNISIKNVIEDIFFDKRNIAGYTTPVGSDITDWNSKDTVIDIEIGEGQGIWTKGSYVTNGWVGGGVWLSGGNVGSASSSSTGKAGSMSRFAIMNNYLYAVSNSTLNSIDITNLQQPIIASKQNIGWNIETIYPFKDKLFIGSQSGMQIYNVDNAMQPTYVSAFSHARLCDPVIADDHFAYITLHASANICVGTQNELDIVDISNLSNPTLVKRIDLTKPQGLSKDGNTLFVCDDDAGIRVFDATNPANIELKQTLPLLATYDIICNNGIAIVSAKDGIHQYNYSNPNNITKLSKFGY